MTSLAAAAARLSLAYGQQLAMDFAVSAMNSLVLITRPGSSGYDQTTREYSPPNTVVVYDSVVVPGAGDIAGVTSANGPITYNIGDEPTYYESLTVTIPTTCPIQPRIDDLVTIKDNPDRDLINRVFRVTDVPAGGRINPSTTLTCTGIAPSRQWEP